MALQDPAQAPISNPMLREVKVAGHDYTIILQGVKEGRYMALTVASLLPGPVLSILQSLAQKVGWQGIVAMQEDGQLLNMLLPALIDSDLKELSPALKEMILSLRDDHRFMDNLFRGVVRDGKALESANELNMAYAGNWAEYYEAIFAIINANGWISFPNTSES